MSIDDYLDGLLLGSSEPSRKAIMKLTKLIENFGGIMVKSTERMEDYINTLDIRISAIEQALGIARATAAPSFAAQIAAAAPAQTQVQAPAVSTAAPAGAPDLTSAPSGAPNLTAAPSGNVDAPDLSQSAIPAPAGNQGATGSGISSVDLMKAAANLQKAPVSEGPGGEPDG
ncbi:MAG: hypothetical protein ACXABK_01215, partial [Candidatus Heimdallarchaeaceae archaeon]